MRDSVPSMRYSSVCNVLRQWNISLIPILIESTDSMIEGAVKGKICSLGSHADSLKAVV